MGPVLREKPKEILKQLRYLSAVGDIADRLGWDRLRVILLLDEMVKAGLVERTDTERYGLTDKGKKTLERIEAGEVLAELPTASKKSNPKIIRPEKWIEEWKKPWLYK